MPGIFKCAWTPEDLDQYAHSQKIDAELEKDRIKYQKQVKLLLLGAGDSGKSTFLKQMRIIHGDGFSVSELDEYRQTVYKNILMGMKVLVDACVKLRIPWGDPSSFANARHLMQFTHSMYLDSYVFLDYAQSVVELWKDNGIQEAYKRRSSFQLADSVSYFFDNLDRISVMEYVPTDADILYIRKATRTMTEFTVHIANVPFLFVDVGGQRTQRQKWFQCFDSVTSILFLASSSEFDQVLLEDRSTNRMEESLNIFGTIVNNRNFRNVSIILFLNKTDILTQKICKRQNNISHFFTDFTGDSFDQKNVQQFILQKFVEQRKIDRDRRPLFSHYTTAVDTQNIKFVFSSVKETILHKNLETMLQ